ncbi:uncharacterized protein [Macrobrachium rosenbergii]|uniref:uncharacterized protein n=1 Tax=Macrobrachium rosenbergii TaxID=79674 RepID=UPI0034D3F7D3
MPHQVGCDEVEKVEIWKEMDRQLSEIPAEERLIIGSDMNEYVGRTREGIERVHGGWGVGERNDERERVADFAVSFDLAIVITWFEKKENQYITYTSGARESQIDFLICRKSSLREYVPSPHITHLAASTLVTPKMTDTTNAASTSPASDNAAAASIHLLPFTTHNPEAWFFRAETIFRSKMISSSSCKADAVLEFLPDDVFGQIAEWLTDQQTTTIYEVLKDHLRSSFSMLPALRARKFLDNIGAAIGYQRLSHVYKQLWQLVNISTTDDVGPFNRAHTTTRSSSCRTAIVPEQHRDRQQDRGPCCPHTPLLKLQEGEQTKVQAQKRMSQGHMLLPLEVWERGPKMQKWLPHVKKHESSNQPTKQLTVSAMQTGYLLGGNSSVYCCLFSRYEQTSSMCFFIIYEKSNTEFLVDTGACKLFIPANPHERLKHIPSTLQVSSACGALLKIYRKRNMNLSFGRKKYNWTFITLDITISLLRADFLKEHNMLVEVARQQLISLPAPVAPLTLTLAPEIHRLLKEFPEVFMDNLQHDLTKPAKHHVQHHTVTEGSPVHTRFRRLAPDKLAHTRQAFQDMEQAGICQKAYSPWASPVHMEPKADAHGDHLAANNDSILKRCFGLQNTGVTFQRLMDEILGDLSFCVIYFDDILIFSPNLKQHMKDARQVLQILKENGFSPGGQLRMAKPTVEFLGHQISPNGVKLLPAKVQAISNFPKLTTIKAVQELTGMISYYHQFIPNLAEIMHPIYSCFKGKPKNLCWSLTLTTDASNTAMGMVLEQDTDNGHRSLAFFSKKSLPAEQKYSMFDLELLAVHRAIHHFHHILEG